MKSILEDIKNRDFRKVYLFYGQEDYLKKQYRDRLAKALGSDDSMNFNIFRGKGLDPSEIISMGETMPFLSESRTILVEDSGFFKKQVDRLPEYLSEMPEYLHFIFVESEVDKRNRLFKAVKKEGKIVEFAVQTEDTLMRWVLKTLQREGKKITRQDMDFFLASVGNDMNQISKEVEKLLSYKGDDDTITRADIEAICSVQVNNRIFDMVRAVAQKDQKTALRLYYDLLELKEPPMRILFLLARQFNQLFQVKELMTEGEGQKAIADKLGLRSFVVRNYMGYARQFDRETLLGAVNDFLQAEEDVKTGILNDRLSVEMLIVRYSEG